MTNLILDCPACGQKNRVPAERLAGHPRCGKCHQPVDPTAPVEVDEGMLGELVAGSALPVLADFWAPWCGPCRMVAPVLAQVARKNAGKVLVVKANTDDNPGAGARHRVSGIPTLVLFRGGHELERLVGAHPQPHIERMLERHQYTN